MNPVREAALVRQIRRDLARAGIDLADTPTHTGAWTVRLLADAHDQLRNVDFGVYEIGLVAFGAIEQDRRRITVDWLLENRRPPSSSNSVAIELRRAGAWEHSGHHRIVATCHSHPRGEPVRASEVDLTNCAERASGLKTAFATIVVAPSGVRFDHGDEVLDWRDLQIAAWVAEPGGRPQAAHVSIELRWVADFEAAQDRLKWKELHAA